MKHNYQKRPWHFQGSRDEKRYMERCRFWTHVGVITTLGMIIGLHSGTQSKLAVEVGVTILAMADALSDALEIHVSEEAEMEHTTKELGRLHFSLSYQNLSLLWLSLFQ